MIRDPRPLCFAQWQFHLKLLILPELVKTFINVTPLVETSASSHVSGSVTTSSKPSVVMTLSLEHTSVTGLVQGGCLSECQSHADPVSRGAAAQG